MFIEGVGEVVVGVGFRAIGVRFGVGPAFERVGIVIELINFRPLTAFLQLPHIFPQVPVQVVRGDVAAVVAAVGGRGVAAVGPVGADSGSTTAISPPR